MESYEDLAVSYYNLGMLGKDPELLRKAANIYEMLVKACPSVSRYQTNLQIVMRSIQLLSES